MNEVWLDIENYEGLYQVSNFGRVRTVPHYSVDKLGRKYFVGGRILRLHTYPNGYKDVMLQHEGKAKRHLVHRLVANAFIPNPNNLPEINHKDESRDNNCANNLEWCDRSYNCNYGSYNEKRSALAKGRKWTDEQRKAQSERLKGRPSPNKGKHLSEEAKQKLRIASTGRIPNESTREKMSIARKKYWQRKRGLLNE